MLGRYDYWRAFFYFTSIALFAYAVYAAIRLTGRISNDMIAQGWDAYLGLANPAALPFMVTCLRDGACEEIFTDVWVDGFPWLIVIAAIVFSIASIVVVLINRLPSGADKDPGGARWADDDELSSLLYEEKTAWASPLRGYIGHTDSGKVMRIPEAKRNAHILVVGGPGSGKTTRYFKQNMVLDAHDGVSGVIFDLKYPDAKGGFFGMIPYYQKQGFDVQLFAPYDDETLGLPLLIGGEDFEGASEFARMVSPIDPNAGDAEFYKNQERKLLTGLVMAFMRKGESSIGKLYALLVAGSKAVSRFINEHADDEVKALFASFFELDMGKLSGIINGLEGKLQIFYDKRLDRATTMSMYPWENVDLDSIGTKKSLLYVGIPQEKLLSGDGQLLLRMIKRVIDRAMLSNARHHGGTLPVDTSFYLDEFPSLGELPNMEENFATMRSYRVGYHVAIQNRAQLETTYGPLIAKSLLSNLFQHILIFPRYLKFDDAVFFSEAVGEMTVVETSHGRMSSMDFLSDHRHNMTSKVATRPLMSPEEMMSWPDAVGVVIPNGMPPIRAIMPRLDQGEVQGVRNQLQHYNKHLPYKVDPIKIRKALLATRHAGMMKELSGKGELAAIIEAKRKHKPLDVTSADKGVVDTGVQDDFGTWIDAVIKVKPKVNVHYEGDNKEKITKISIDTTSLPSNLAEPAQLKIWLKQRWLKKQRENFGIVASGFKLLGKERVSKLAALPRSKPKSKSKPQAKGQATGEQKQKNQEQKSQAKPKDSANQGQTKEPVKAKVSTEQKKNAPSTQKDKVPSKPKEQEPSKTSAQDVSKGAVQSEAQANYVAWIDEVIKAKPAVKVHREGDEGSKVTKITIDTTSLSLELAQPKGSKAWVKQRWLKKQGGKFGVLAASFDLIGEERKIQLVALPRVESEEKDQTGKSQNKAPEKVVKQKTKADLPKQSPHMGEQEKQVEKPQDQTQEKTSEKATATKQEAKDQTLPKKDEQVEEKVNASDSDVMLDMIEGIIDEDIEISDENPSKAA